MCDPTDQLDPDRWRLVIALEVDPELLDTPAGRARVHARLDRLTRELLHELTTGRHVA